MTTVWHIISYFGDAPYWIGLTIAILLMYPLLSRRDQHRMAWMVFALLPAVLISHEIASLLKDAIALPRPCVGLADCPTGFSFPSGHAAVVFAFATVASCITRKRFIFGGLFALAILVSISRVALNYHFVSDVVAGAVIGAGVGFLFYRSYKPIHGFLEKKKLVP